VLFLERSAYLFGQPHQGDVIVFRNRATGEEATLVKRVIGAPGDSVAIEAGRVYLNGRLLDEPYVFDSDDYTYPSNGLAVRVPPNAYFVLGDNRPISADSHLGWLVSSDEVIGKAVALPFHAGS
jgi:signal peptidase I